MWVKKVRNNEEFHDVSRQNREMSGAKHEMSSVMQRVVLAVGPLEAKSAPFSSKTEILEGAMERQKMEPKEQRSERNEAAEQYSSFFRVVGGPKSSFRDEDARGGCSKMYVPLKREALFP